jgi:hypothetical protein
MYKKNNLILFLLGCLAVLPAVASQKVAKNNRGLTRKEGVKSYWARSTEVDPCSSRNIAENVRFFFQCAKTKLPNYVISGQGGVLQWDKSKVFAMNNGAIQTGTIPVVISNQGLFTMWNSLYKEYASITREEMALIDEMLGGALDEAEDAANSEDPHEGQAILDQFSQKESNLQAKILSVNTRWETFLQSIPSNVSQYRPNTEYPIAPDPLSPVFLTQTTKSGVWLVSEQFYADVRKLLDDNPNAHLQLMKYYLLENPAQFRRLSWLQNSFAQADKSFKISLLCADIASVEGLILTIAAGAAPPLPYLPVRACQFSGKRIAISDNSPISDSGMPSAGTSYSF